MSNLHGETALAEIWKIQNQTGDTDGEPYKNHNPKPGLLTAVDLPGMGPGAFADHAAEGFKPYKIHLRGDIILDPYGDFNHNSGQEKRPGIVMHQHADLHVT